MLEVYTYSRLLTAFSYSCCSVCGVRHRQPESLNIASGKQQHLTGASAFQPRHWRSHVCFRFCGNESNVRLLVSRTWLQSDAACHLVEVPGVLRAAGRGDTKLSQPANDCHVLACEYAILYHCKLSTSKASPCCLFTQQPHTSASNTHLPLDCLGTRCTVRSAMAKQFIVLAVVCCFVAVAHASVAPAPKQVSPAIATTVL
jgi:hypothetical protein